MKKRRYLFDAGALSLYYAGDKRVRPYFEETFGKSGGFVSEVNLAEFYYKSGQRVGLQMAEAWYLQIRRSNIRVVAPNEEITRSTARLKIKYYTKLSLADCFAIASADFQGASIITTDQSIKEAKEVPSIYLEVEERVGEV